MATVPTPADVDVNDWRKVTDFSKWLVSFRNPATIASTHSSYLAFECFLYVQALICVISAFRRGGRLPLILLAAVLHGLLLEVLCYLVPDVDNFWQAHSMVMFFGHRYPLHILCLYGYFFYFASTLTSRLNLAWWAEPFAAGLIVVMIDLPMDILGIKSLWWVWHDTDPGIYDRHYWVPWTSYYFHTTFTFGFWCLFNGLHKVIAGGQRSEYRGFFSEFIVALLSATFTSGFGILMLMVVYHPLHDFHGIHSEVPFHFILGLWLFIVWVADRKRIRSTPQSSSKGGCFSIRSFLTDELGLMAVLHSLFFLAVAFLSDPGSIRTTGFFQEVGPCHVNQTVNTVVGPAFREKYLCPTNFRSSEYFNFNCLSQSDRSKFFSQAEKGPLAWYTVCGTPFPNRIEYIAMIVFSCLLCLAVSYQLLSQASPFAASKPSEPKKKQN